MSASSIKRRAGATLPHLNPSMAAQVEVELGRMRDGAVNCGASWDITALPNLQGAIDRGT